MVTKLDQLVRFKFVFIFHTIIFKNVSHFVNRSSRQSLKRSNRLSMQKSTEIVPATPLANPPLTHNQEATAKHENVTIVNDVDNENTDVEIELETAAAVKPVNELEQTPTNADSRDKELTSGVNSPLKLAEKTEPDTVS